MVFYVHDSFDDLPPADAEPDRGHPYLENLDVGIWFRERFGEPRDIDNKFSWERRVTTRWNPEGITTHSNLSCVRTLTTYTTKPQQGLGCVFRFRALPYVAQADLFRYFLFNGDTDNFMVNWGVTAQTWNVSGLVLGEDTEAFDGKWHTVIWNYYNDTNLNEVIVDGGRKYYSDTKVIASSTVGRLQVNGRDDSNRRWGSSVVAYARIHTKPIPQNLWAPLHSDPYAPFRRPIFSPDVTGGGPVTHTGTGVLQAQPASVTGVGDVIGVITGDGALQAQPAAVTGVGDLIGAIEGTGTLQAQDAAVVGAGAIVQDGTGTLQAQDAAVVGVGEVGNVRTGMGALQAQDATVTGVGDRASVGTGALQAQDAAVVGVGEVEGLTTGTGTLQAQDAAVSGLGEFTFEGTGVLQAQDSAVTGVGFNLGEITLTPGDLAAIQQVVWAAPEAQELLSKVNEIWRRRGLDSGNPHTYDKVNNQIRVADIVIDLTGDANEVTQTRRP